MTQPIRNVSVDAPIGIFDSGVGGLSVLRHVHAQLPHEHLIYFADSGYAPYGDREEEWVIQRSLAVAAFLFGQGVKALVVACNTATVAAIKAIRTEWPGVPIVGVEPGLKPGAAASRSGKVGVLATDRTLHSEKFLTLRDQISAATQAEFLLQPCIGLVDQIELGQLGSAGTMALLEQYVSPLLDRGADTLVLGCTHYPFVENAIRQVLARHASHDASAPVTLIDTGDAVARQLARLLEGAGLLRPAGVAHLRGYTSASAAVLAEAFRALLSLTPQVDAVDVA
ncbi:glutamate racemase [Pseudoduganella umbonata]|uniref:Glutamate racemase n=1 Tax=Pseudoduganella umbonata TaxID=864828 RepID=A0A4P8HUG3_9BURK|nr:glutamate racemase [Pseudoduganella umbonata]MBB3223486.1 glutamate racemase [Pseudoduganella umbonata]QCP13627.1 glutamate racemase [Pseudoduganella umbonata]